MNVKHASILTFLAVAEMRSFRRAAEVLNTTQPNVSNRIAELESLIGQPLFHRSRSSVALTPRGEELMMFAEHVRRAHREFEENAGLKYENMGKLRIAVSASLVQPFLINFLDKFSKRYPSASIDLQIESTANQQKELIERRVDLCFLMGPVSNFRVTNLPLVTLPVIWVARKGHEATTRSHLTIHDLSNWALISFSKESRPYALLVESLRQAGVINPRLFSSNLINATIDMVKAGLGIGSVPRAFVEESLASGDLVALSTDIPLAPLEFTASFNGDDGSSLARSVAELARVTASESYRS